MFHVKHWMVLNNVVRIGPRLVEAFWTRVAKVRLATLMPPHQAAPIGLNGRHLAMCVIGDHLELRVCFT